MSTSPDRLYDLLPAVYRQRDEENGQPLRDLLRVIGKQVDVVEEDIDQLYENWFIETCQDWVVPYLGDLIGYRPVHEAGEPGDVSTTQGRQLNRILIPRREVANTIRYRRRKGTLALLELLAYDVSGWHARAVEFYKLLGLTQAINHLRPARGQTVDLCREDVLDRLDGPFDELAHSVDVRRIASHRTRGRYNIPSVGLFVWRLKNYPSIQAPAYCREEDGNHCYTFSVLGNDSPLYARPTPELEPTDIADEPNLPVPIRRRALEARKTDYYGRDKSLQIWVKDWGEESDSRQPVPPERIVPADLAGWHYRPRREEIAVDPERGRIAFHPRHVPSRVWVSYHYGFSADLGGGEYHRPLSQTTENFTLYRVRRGQKPEPINEALRRWRREKPRHAIIEITDSEVYVERINISLEENQTLQLRAANHKRPVIRLLDRRTDQPDSLSVSGKRGSRFTLDGLLVTGRGVHIEGKLTSVTIRHSTLVPGWTLRPDCEPWRPAEPSLQLFNTPHVCVNVEHSIVGSIQFNQDQVQADPIRVLISDSILDATSPEREAMGAPDCLVAHARLTIARSTVFGQVQVHAIDLAENSIFDGRVRVGRRQWGCMRFCYVAPGSRTPLRYNCQPDLVEQTVNENLQTAPNDERLAALERERERARPRFNSFRYGTPTYCQLSEACAEEIKRGADDESEMGAFHDLYQPQREANLRVRLDEYTPAGTDAGIIFAS
jgi:hypothetical protein